MFFFPIGHEDSKIRRFPIVSVIIVLICILAFAHTWSIHKAEEKEVMTAVNRLMVRAAEVIDGDYVGSSGYVEIITVASEAGDVRALLSAIEERISRCGRGPEVQEIETEIVRIRRLLEDEVFHRHGLIPSKPTLLGFITHMFLHGGFLHLLFNMIFFFLVGPSLEDLWGRCAFGIFYLLAGAAAALGYMAVSGASRIPMIGASGAIAGLMGSFLLTFTYTRIKMCGIVWLGIIFRVFTFSIPAWLFFPFWIGKEILNGALQLGTVGAEQGGVAHWAHISGFFFGLAIPPFLRITGLQQRLYALSAGRRKDGGAISADHTLGPAYRLGVRLREDGDWARAAETFRILSEKHPDSPAPLVELAEVHRAAGDEMERKNALLRALDVAARAKAPEIIEIYDILRREFSRVEIPPDRLLRVGSAMEAAGRTIDAADCLRRFVDRCSEHPMWVRGAIRLADLYAERLRNPDGARDLLAKAREVADPSWHEDLDRRLRAFEKDMSSTQGPDSIRRWDDGPPPGSPAPSRPAKRLERVS